MIRHFIPGLLTGSEREAAGQIGLRTYELSDFLVSVLGVEDTGASFQGRVTFHDSCHQLRELGIREQPRTLLRAVRGLEFVELENADRCCGFGGTFAVKFEELSSAIGSDKVEAIEKSGAQWVVANDVSCLMHLAGLLKRSGSRVGTMHLAEMLVR